MYLSSILTGRAPFGLKSVCLAVAMCAAIPGANAQFWIRDSTVMPESLTGGGSSGRDGTLTFTNAIYGGLEYNDNITLSSSGDSGLAMRVGLVSGIHYPVSANNELSLELSLERLIYLTGAHGATDYNNLLPGTQTTFTVFIGSIRIRNYFKASLTEDPVQSPTVNNTDRFGRFNAQLGTQIDWDMNRVIWQGSVAVARQLAMESVNSQIDLWNYAVGLRCVFPTGPGSSLGISTTYGITRYDDPIQNDSSSRSLGVFGALNLSKTMNLQAAAGYQWTDYENTGSITDSTDSQGLYTSLSLSHQIHRRLGYTLSLSREINEGYGTNFYELTDLSLSPRFKMVNKWELVGTVGWQWIDESGPTGESAERLKLMMEARRPLGRKLDLSAGFAHYEKFSDTVGKDYVQNRVYFSLRYTF